MEVIKVRYAIEKEMEVPKDYNKDTIQNIIEQKYKEENGLDILWGTEDELKKDGLTGLLDNL